VPKARSTGPRSSTTIGACWPQPASSFNGSDPIGRHQNKSMRVQTCLAAGSYS
jgi:hypothetical protein